MCGLVGMVGTLNYKHKRAMAELLFLDTLRGRDSTGLAAVARNREVLLRKMAVPGYEFIEYPAVEKMMKPDDQLWIGHNRFKTTGEVSKANAHPFQVLDDEGDIILVGAHNGTLDNKYEIERQLERKFDTDSEGLFNLLVEAPNFRSAINKLKGAWSLVFWDPTTDTVNFCRNKERPLVFAFTKDRRVMIWASESWMIKAACGRHDIELETNDKGLSCYATLPDHLYSLPIPQERDQVLPDMIREGGYAGQARFFQGWSSNWWNDEDPNDTERYELSKEQKEKTQREKDEEADREDAKKILNLGLPPGTRRGYDGKPISQKDFDEIKAVGCVWNGCEIGRVFAFIDDKAMICGDCLCDSHPKDGDRVQSGEDDEPPFDLSSENSSEHKRLIDASVGAAQKAVG